MNRKLFTVLLNAIKKQQKLDLDLFNYLEDNDIGISGLYNNSVLSDAILYVLKHFFPDEFETIEYFIYDLSFGDNWEEGMITEILEDKTEKDIDLSSIDKLYDYLNYVYKYEEE